MQCLVVDDDRKFSYKLSGYIDSFLKGIFKNYQVLEINEKFDDFLNIRILICYLLISI